MILFKTPTEFDFRCLTTFGVNVKNDQETAIGYFGTGLKYAVAVFLRLNCEVYMWTGGNCYQFVAKKENIRGKSFKIVYMTQQSGDKIEADLPLGFTTELGKHWEAWMAYRELESNTRDENGETINVRNHLFNIPPQEQGHTIIGVKGAAADAVYDDRFTHFIYKHQTPVAELESISLFLGEGYFYKRIWVGKATRPLMFRYNFTKNVDLTEDRTVSSDWSLRRQLVKELLQSDNYDLIRKIISAPQDTMEAHLDWDDHFHLTPSDAWMNAVHALRHKTKDIGVSETLRARFKKQDNTSFLEQEEDVVLDAVQKKQLSRAIAFLTQHLNCDGLGETYPIRVLNNCGDNALGRAESDTIYLSPTVFDRGTKLVAITIFEEYCHIVHEVHDETLAQKWLYLETIFKLVERLAGEPL